MGRAGEPIVITKRGKVVARLVPGGTEQERPWARLRGAAAAHPRSVEIVPVTPAIAAEVAALPATFHRDPADRLIVATCRVLGATLLTHDLLITRSRLVTRWRPGR